MARMRGRKASTARLDCGVAEANAIVSGCLFAAAKGGSIAAQIFWLKSRARWRERDASDHRAADGDADAIAEIAELARLVGVSQLCTTRAKLYGNSRAGNTNLRPLSFALSISVNATRARKIADGELDLESADRAVVPKVRARLGRVVAGEDDCHR